MITFYANEALDWNDVFDFSKNINLIAHTKTDHKGFLSRQELIEFCKSFGAKLDDPSNPFKIEGPIIEGPTFTQRSSLPVYTVTQKVLLGWITDDYK